MRLLVLLRRIKGTPCRNRYRERKWERGREALRPAGRMRDIRCRLAERKKSMGRHKQAKY